MADFPGSIEWVAELISDVEAKATPFIVDTDGVDDELVEVFIDEIRRLTGELQEGLAQAQEVANRENMPVTYLWTNSEGKTRRNELRPESNRPN